MTLPSVFLNTYEFNFVRCRAFFNANYLSQEFPLENITMILSVSCLHVAYNAVAYVFVLPIFQYISGVVLIIFHKEVNNHYL